MQHLLRKGRRPRGRWNTRKRPTAQGPAATRKEERERGGILKNQFYHKLGPSQLHYVYDGPGRPTAPTRTMYNSVDPHSSDADIITRCTRAFLVNKIKGFFEHRQTGDISPDIMRSAGIRMFWAINSARNQHTGSHFKPLSLRISQVSKFRRAISKRMRFVHTWLHKRPCLQTLPRIKGGSPGYGQTQGLDHTVILHKLRVIAPTFSKMSIPQIDKECDYSHLVRAVEYSIVPNSNTALCHLPSLIPRITPKTRSLKFSNCEHTAELHNLFCV